jgi:hypothetical protein
VFLPKTLIYRITLIGLVTNHALWSSFDKATFDGGFNQLYFVGRSALYVKGDRKTSSSAIAMILVLLTRFVLPTKRPPFLRV